MEFTENESFIPYKEPPLKQDNNSFEKADISEVTKCSDKRYKWRCIIVDIVCAVLCILLLTFCSCDDYHYAQGGVITDIDKVTNYGHTYFRCKVHCHKTWIGLSTDFYLLTDSAYQIGDWVQIK